MFQISALRRNDFEELLSLDDDSLAARGGKWCIADAQPGFPCRVSLEDAEPGERVMLVPFDHQPAHSPYRASGPIFVRERAVTASPAPGTVPALLRSRLLSVRAYDVDHLMTEVELVDGRELESCVARLFGRAPVAYAHIHFARAGCYACRIDRA